MVGIGSAPGKALGRVKRIQQVEYEIVIDSLLNIEEELERFTLAREKTALAIKNIQEQTAKNIGSKEAEIFEAHYEILNDAELKSSVVALIEAGRTAEYAVKETQTTFVEMFRSMDDTYMSERASDIEDVCGQLTKHILGVAEVCESDSASNEKHILVAHDFTPSETATINPNQVAGLLAEIGGKTSHSSIMARTMGLPAVVGIGENIHTLMDNTLVIMDGETGQIQINPSEQDIKDVIKTMAQQEKKKNELKKWIGKDTKTLDGKRIELACNIGSVDDLENVLKSDGEGIGLFRTEFLYMNHHEWPSESVQFEAYKKVLESLENKPVIIRTLDIGGDKTLDYYEMKEEMNPFLGHRAIRLCLEKTDIFRTQLRALLRASVYGQLKIMFPMISSLEELILAKEQLEIAKSELQNDNIEFSDTIQVGMMIEIPSVAVMADIFAKHVDFFSIGTNDLTQYTLACDRMNQDVSHLYSHLHPAVLRLVYQVAKSGVEHGIMVGMCGEAAGDQDLQPFLIGAGLTELSMSAASVLESRASISKLELDACKTLTEDIIKLSTKDAVINTLKSFREKSLGVT